MNQAQKDQIQKYIQAAANEGMMAISKKVLDYLEQETLSYVQRIKCIHLGVHHENRGGIGIDLNHMVDLVKNISAVGYVDDISTRVCIELDGSPASECTRQGEVCSCSSSLTTLTVLIPFDDEKSRWYGCMTDLAFQI